MHIKTVLIAAGLLATAGTAVAHPKLLSVSPTANAVVANPSHVDLRFSEKLVPAFSKADVTMAAMRGMGAMTVASASSLANDGKRLVVTPKARLAPGKYIVNWHVVSMDTHKAAGSYAFSVR